jgi:hypothetical protein
VAAEKRCLLVNKRQWDKLGKATGYGLQIPDSEQMPRPVAGVFDVTEHNGCSGRQAQGMRGFDHLEPLGRVDFVRADDLANLVVQDLSRRTGKSRQASLFERLKKFSYPDAKGFGSLLYLER